MKYARMERERRFLLAKKPVGLPSEHNVIRDWYFKGTRLRLRRVETHAGDLVALKLTQKYEVPSRSFGQTIITNLYLNEHEFNHVRTLGGYSIRKRRYAYAFGRQPCVIDIFDGSLDGLLLAEIGFDDDVAMTSCPIPEFVVAEVTTEALFTGANLACIQAEDLERELLRRGVTCLTSRPTSSR
jgi:CYTH domain-containing protein